MSVYAAMVRPRAHRAHSFKVMKPIMAHRIAREIADARLRRSPRGYPTAAAAGAGPIARAKLIDVNDIPHDAKSGVTGWAAV